MNRSPFLIAAMLLLAACGGPVADARIERLKAAIGDQPLDESAAERLSAEKTAIDELARKLARRAQKNSDARLNWQVGELQRLRHLFDEPGAWEEAERHLSIALARDPSFAPAHVALGRLYLAGGIEMAPKAEREFVRALELAGDKAAPEARKGLFLAYYYQGRWAEASAASDRYLASNPGDVDVRKMKAMTDTNLAASKETSK